MQEQYAIIDNLSHEVVTIKRGSKMLSCVFNSIVKAEEIAESLEEDGRLVHIQPFKTKKR